MLPGTGSRLDRGRFEGVAALLGVQLLFGLFPLFVHFALAPEHGFAPRALVFWRILFGALLLGGITLARYGRAFWIPLHELPALFGCALLGVPANMALAMEGIARTSVLHAGLLVTLMPVFTYAIAVLSRLERASPRRTWGIAIALSGAATLVLSRASGSSPLGTSRLGPLLMLANCVSYSAYLVSVRTFVKRHPPLVVIAWVFLLSLAALPLLALGTPLWPERIGARAALGFGYALLGSTVLTYFLNAYALARVPASTAAVFIFLQPLVAGVAGGVVLGEAPTSAAWVAGALLFTGIWLVAGEREPARGGTSDSIQRLAGRVFHSRR